MTTIAYKDKIIASDSCWTNSSDVIITKRIKVDQLPNGVVIGQAGDNDGRAICELFSKINTPSELPPSKEILELGCDCTCIIIFPNGQTFILEVELDESRRKESQFYETREKFIAIGSGAKIALG